MIPQDTTLKEAYINGTLRKICKDTNISYTAIIKRAKLENWPTQISTSVDLISSTTQEIQRATTPLQKGKIYAAAMGNAIATKILPHAESAEIQDILRDIDAIEKADKIARRSFGLDQESANGPTLNINVLAAGLEVFLPKEKEKVLDNVIEV